MDLAGARQSVVDGRADAPRDTPLIALKDAELAFGMTPLLDRASLAIDDGYRVGLIGRNGTGKSSLLGVLAGTLALDDGEVQRKPGLRVAIVEQEPVLPAAATVRESLLAARQIARHRGRARPACRRDPAGRIPAPLLRERDRIAGRSCSGGERKRAALALAFALDSRTTAARRADQPPRHRRHRDPRRNCCRRTSPAWSSRMTGDSWTACHGDRRTRPRSTDRFPGQLLRLRAEESPLDDAAEDLATRRFEKFWAQEEVWIRKGVEARRTRNEGRVKRLEHLREERAARRERLGSIKLTVDSGERSGKLVAEFENVSKSFGERHARSTISPLRIMRGDRVGLLGPNGAGKTTLIRLIVGTLEPDSGPHPPRHQPAGGVLRSAARAAGSGKDAVRDREPGLRLGRDRRFPASTSRVTLVTSCFRRGRANAPIRMLSGGERNRLLLARLFARPANVLVLDEPTNDLDIDSLELLENLLQDYTGTLLLVSHDRAFLDNVVTQTIAAEGEGGWREYVGGYTDWLRQRPQSRAAVPVRAMTTMATAPPAEPFPTPSAS